MTDKLKPCPFCGAKDKELELKSISNYWDITCWDSVFCPKCYFSGPPAKTKEEAVEKWNARQNRTN